MATNTEKFRAAYLETITASHTKNLANYFYSADQIPVVVDKMVKSLAKGDANLSAAIKSAAKRVGIKPTMGAIKAYLATFDTKMPMVPDADGTKYKIETITDATGTRWWVNCWDGSTPYYAMGVSASRVGEPDQESVNAAKVEALTDRRQPGARVVSR